MPLYKYNTQHGIKWSAKFNYFDDEAQIRKTIFKKGFATRREAKEFEDSFLDNLDLRREQKNNPKEQVKTFKDVYDEYLASHKREDMKESTLQTKVGIFEKRIFPTFRDTPIDKITDDSIADWQNTLKNTKKNNGKPFSDSYLRTIQSQFNSIINYAFIKGYIKNNPLADIKNMGVKGKRIVFWTTEEYEKFAYCAMKHPEYYYAYEVLYWCGLREGEMLALTLKDIDFTKKEINIDKTYARIKGKNVITTPKTPSSVRKVSMPDFLCDELREYIATLYNPGDDTRIFFVSKSNLIKFFQIAIEEAGVKRITIHGLRHSHVSLLISKKYDIFEISKRIGHKSVKTTQDTYGHLFDEVQRSIAHTLDQLRG